MIRYQTIGIFLLAGCAIAPAVALYTRQPAVAIASHVILIALGLMAAVKNAG